MMQTMQLYAQCSVENLYFFVITRTSIEFSIVPEVDEDMQHKLRNACECIRVYSDFNNLYN